MARSFALSILILFLAVGEGARAQWSYNGDFRYFGTRFVPSVWYPDITTTKHEYWVDTSCLFHGQASLRIRSNERAGTFDDFLLYHEQDLSAWPPHAAIKASFYMSVAKADSDFFTFFVNNNPCGDFG